MIKDVATGIFMIAIVGIFALGLVKIYEFIDRNAPIHCEIK